METTEVLQPAEASAIYAGYARAFRYPEDNDGPLSRSEYMAAFDQGASSSALSVRESTYADLDASALFEELVRYYEHFGLRRKEDAELPDHISIELEFMHFLCELEHHALLGGQEVTAVHSAQRDFIDRHVKRLLNGLLQGMAARRGTAVELVNSCAEFVEMHRQALATD